LPLFVERFKFSVNEKKVNHNYLKHHFTHFSLLV
jgi:hypothetical protein